MEIESKRLENMTSEATGDDSTVAYENTTPKNKRLRFLLPSHTCSEYSDSEVSDGENIIYTRKADMEMEHDIYPRSNCSVHSNTSAGSSRPSLVYSTRIFVNGDGMW